MVSLSNLHQNRLFQLFVIWKKLTLDEIKNKTNIEYLEILQQLDSLQASNIITTGSGPVYSLIESDSNYDNIQLSKKIIQENVQKELDSLFTLIKNNWEDALDKWEMLTNVFGKILEQDYNQESVIIKQVLFEKTKKKLKL